MRLRIQSRKPATNWLARGQQTKLLLLVMLAGGVMILMERARDPATWRWLFGDGQLVAQAVLTADRVSPEEANGNVKFQAAKPLLTDAPVESRPSAPADAAEKPPLPTAAEDERFDPRDYFPGVQSIASYFHKIHDYAPLTEHDEDAWFQLLDLLRGNPQERLERATIGHVGYRQLLNQPKYYRGRVVTVAGNVRAAERIPIAKNTYQVEGTLFRLWLYAPSTRQPIVVYAMETPPGFPLGTDISARVEATGIFFKSWSYPYENQPRMAPLILAKLVRWNESRVSAERQAAPRADEEMVAALTPADVAAVREKHPSPREYMHEFWDIPSQSWKQWTDDQPTVGPDSSDGEQALVLARLMLHGPSFPPRPTRVWLLDDVPLTRLAGEPAQHRGGLFRVEGLLTDVAIGKLRPELAKRFDMPRMFRCQLQPAAGPPVVVYTKTVPERFTQQPIVNERVGFTGIFLKREPAADGQMPLVFVADRLAWYRSDPLGDLGFDAGLLDRVRGAGPLVADDNPAFYELMSKARSLDVVELHHRARAEMIPWQTEEAQRLKVSMPRAGQPSHALLVVALRSGDLRGSSPHAGRLATMEGTALRCERIEVTDAAAREKYGLDHYYEVNLSLLLDMEIAEATKAAAGNAQPPTQNQELPTRREYPVVFCVPRLPEGFPQGAEIREEVRAPGFFLKLWNVQTEGRGGAGQPGRELSPLFIGPGLIWTPSERTERTHSWPMMVAIGLGMLSIIVTIGMLWKWSRGDQGVYEMAVARQRSQLPEKLDETAIETVGPPDFSFLHKEEQNGDCSGLHGA